MRTEDGVLAAVKYQEECISFLPVFSTALRTSAPKLRFTTKECDKRRIETLPNDLKLNSYILHRAFAYPLWIGGCCFDGIMQMKNVGLNVGI